MLEEGQKRLLVSGVHPAYSRQSPVLCPLLQIYFDSVEHSSVDIHVNWLRDCGVSSPLQYTQFVLQHHRTRILRNNANGADNGLETALDPEEREPGNQVSEGFYRFDYDGALLALPVQCTSRDMHLRTRTGAWFSAL